MQLLKNWIKRNFTWQLYGAKTKPVRKQELLARLEQWETQAPAKLPDASFDIFTYHGEDGILVYLLKQLKDVPPVFVDAGAGNCIVGNCSTLAIHFGWTGLFIDKDRSQVASGKRFYNRSSRGTGGISFISEEIDPGNINKIIAHAGIKGEVGLLSVDIDGNDYWIWKAIHIIQPRVVIIEAKVEFGLQDVIVPYGSQNHRTVDMQYNGASVEALHKLGKEKGYKLVGANRQGYNLFFVRKDEPVPAVQPADVLTDPATINSFYPQSFFNEHKFVTELG